MEGGSILNQAQSAAVGPEQGPEDVLGKPGHEGHVTLGGSCLSLLHVVLQGLQWHGCTVLSSRQPVTTFALKDCREASAAASSGTCTRQPVVRGVCTVH